MTDGRFPALAETYLGLRHGPMSFIRPTTPIVCLLSNDSVVRSYELDLVRELREKKIGHLVGICEVATRRLRSYFTSGFRRSPRRLPIRLALLRGCRIATTRIPSQPARRPQSR